MKNKNAYDRRTKEQAESLMGFGSATAKSLSLSWSASLILNTHYKNNVLAKRNNQKGFCQKPFSSRNRQE